MTSLEPERAPAEARRGAARRRHFATGTLSVAVHAAALAALWLVHPSPALPPEPEPIIVQLVPAPRPVEVAKVETPEPQPKPETPPPPPPKIHARPPKTTPPREVIPVPAAKGPTANGDATVSDSELASAATAGSGGGGRACNMTRLLEGKLRRDPLVQQAVAEANRGQAIRVWNGGWVRHAEQDGAGMAAVREAIMWEVAFAPEPCRNEPVHGLVLISLNDGPGAARLVVGAGAWRWVDLLNRRGGLVER